MTLQEICDRIENELTEAMGPLALVVLKEKAAEFGVNMENLSPDKVPELVEEASFEIQNQRKKVQFQRAALRILRELPQQLVLPAEAKAPEEKPEEGNRIRRKTRLRLAERPRTQGQEENVSVEKKGGLRLAHEQRREGRR
jgi:hypothetical protein